MDPKLAAVYGTAPVNETDVEALATAELASKLAAADELDVSGMSDEEAESLAASLLDSAEGAAEDEAPAEQEEAPAAEEAPAEEQEEKTAGDEVTAEQEKIAEADYLGRVMAHAYVAERREIEAAEKTAAAKTTVKVAAKKDDKKSGKVAAHLKMKKASTEAAPTEELSSLDQLAQLRALEILKENGIDPNAAPEETEKEASMNEDQAAQLAAKVEERATALLIANGYEFEAPEAAAPTDEK